MPRAAAVREADVVVLVRSPRALWRDILAANAREVRRALRAFRRALRARA